MVEKLEKEISAKSEQMEQRIKKDAQRISELEKERDLRKKEFDELKLASSQQAKLKQDEISKLANEISALTQ